MEKKTLTKQEVIHDMQNYLNKTEAHFQVIQKNSDKIYKRTTRVIQTVFATIGILLLFNLYFIYDFSKGILSMTSSMQGMYIHFGKMTDQVHGITKSVKDMTSHIDVLPSMAKSMDSMNQSVTNINTNVHYMQGEVGLMHKDVDSINTNMSDMSYRFEQTNGNIDEIESSVHQMSRAIPKM